MNTKLETLREKMREMMLEHHVPGVAIGLMIDGVEHYECFGVTSVVNPLPITPDTIFQIASITKTYTATMALKLIEAGKLELHAPIRKYIPNFRVQNETASANATIYHLLTHTAGWFGDVELDTGDDANAIEKFVANLTEVPQMLPVGTAMSYSNSGIDVLGRVLEVVTGQTLDVLVKSELLEPLGLHDTVFWSHEAITKRVAVGHKQSDDDEIEVIHQYRLPRVLHASGGLLSSSRDQIRYAQFQMGKHGDDLISSDLRTQMQTPQVEAGFPQWIGYSWHLIDTNGFRVVTHGGDLDGFHCELGFVAAKNFAYSVLTNSDGGSAINKMFGAFVRELFLEIQPEQPKTIANSIGLLEDYVGTYALLFAESADDRVEVRIDSGELMVEVNLPSLKMVLPAAKVRVAANDILVVLNEPMKGQITKCIRVNNRVEFFRTEDRITLTRVKGAP